MPVIRRDFGHPFWGHCCRAAAFWFRRTRFFAGQSIEVAVGSVPEALKYIATETFKVLKQQQEKAMSKHDSVTKRNRRPKSDKRVDYTARTMAAVKKLEQAAKLRK
jgi:hypothetical protein